MPTIDPFKPTAPAPPPPVSADQQHAALVKMSIANSPPPVPQNIQDFNKANGPSTTSPTGKDVFGKAVTIPPTTTTPPSTTTPPATGTPPQGMSQDDYNSFKQANPNIEPDATDVNNANNAQKLSDAKAASDAAAAQHLAEAKQVSDNITNISNGTTPLTTGEQAQIDGLKQSFQVMIDAQNLQNTGAAGLGNIRGYQTGAAEYDPTFQVKTIGAIVSAGQNKIADINTKMASAVASLTQSFKDNDIKAATDAWSVLSAAETEHATALQKTVDDAQAAIKSAQDQAAASQAEADKQATYQLDVAKFQQTGDQNSFDNALKAEQEKFDEQNKTATLALTASNDKATQAIAAFKAGMGAGGGSPLSNIPAAQVTATGGTDPASQKAVLDGITQQYGPMTATAIQSLADYSMNPSDWSSRAGTSGMSRAQAVELAKMYDPTYNDANYAIRASYMKSIASTQTGTIGSAVNSANKAIDHLTSFATLMNKMTTGSPGTRNASTLSQANVEATGVSDEFAKFFKGTGSTDVGSIDSWRSQINPNSTQPGQVKGMVQGAIELMSGQLQTLAEQYTNTMGKAPTADFLGPSARASLSSLKNQGFKVDIPGINYTDKTAWQNNGGTQEQWNGAVDALTKAGLPLTQENILQYAQE